MIWGPCTVAKLFGVEDRRRMWPRLLPPAMLGGWIWGDTRGGFQRKVFLGSGRDVLGLSLTLPAETCQRGARLKKSHPPSMKKKEKNKKKTPKKPNNNNKTPTPTFNFKPLTESWKHNQIKRWVAAALCFHAQINPFPRAHIQPCSCLSSPSWGWGQAGPLGTSTPSERTFRLPKN